MKTKDLASSPQVQWGIETLKKVIQASPEHCHLANFRFKIPSTSLHEEGYRAEIAGNALTVEAATPQGALYALLEICDRIEKGEKLPSSWQDAPMMRYRGYTLGLQKQKSFYPGHKYYDWPISKAHFPWFYDKEHLQGVLDVLAKQRCNLLSLWSSHPFASLIALDEYPDMLEVEPYELLENERQLEWLIEEGAKRGIQILLHFYNIHMPAPLAKSRGWDPMSGVAHEEICEYTRKAIEAFTKKYPKVGFIVCIGEVIAPSDQKKWLEEVILPAVLEGHAGDLKNLPPIILREHRFDIAAHFKDARAIYPNLLSMMKHNSENLVSTRPAPENFELTKISPCHLINVHLSSNLEPFSWGSPKFIRDTAEQMVRQGASGVHIFPLRFWDWPNSAHVNPAGDQLFEHFVWWNAWGRYSWNPYRDEKSEDLYWKKALGKHYCLSEKASDVLLDVLQTTGSTVPEMTAQFLISSGNRQNINLGEFLVPLAFSRLQYKGGSGYSMSQLAGFPLIGEKMWSLSPLERMRKEREKCSRALKGLEPLKNDCHFLKLLFSEIEVLFHLASYYETKAKACALYFQVLYGAPGASEEPALKHLGESLAIYRQIAQLTLPLFRDAGSLHLHRTIPMPAEEGYLHWQDCLPAFEREAECASLGGIFALLKQWSSGHGRKGPQKENRFDKKNL